MPARGHRTRGPSLQRGSPQSEASSGVGMGDPLSRQPDGWAPAHLRKVESTEGGVWPDVGAGRWGLQVPWVCSCLDTPCPVPPTGLERRASRAGTGRAHGFQDGASSRHSVGRKREGNTDTSVVRAPVPKVCAKAPRGAAGPASLGTSRRLGFPREKPQHWPGWAPREDRIGLRASVLAALPSCDRSCGRTGG